MSAAGESGRSIVTVVREGQRIAELEAEIDTLQRQALALGSGLPPAVVLGVRVARREPMKRMEGRGRVA